MSNAYSYFELSLTEQYKDKPIGFTGNFVKVIKLDDAGVQPKIRVYEPSNDKIPIDLNTKINIPETTAGLYFSTESVGIGVIGFLFSFNLDVEKSDDYIPNAAGEEIKTDVLVTVGDTATLVPALVDKLARRKYVRCVNLGLNPVAIINSDGTGTFAGSSTIIQPAGTYEREMQESVNLYMLCNTGLSTTIGVYQDK